MLNHTIIFTQMKLKDINEFLVNTHKYIHIKRIL